MANDTGNFGLNRNLFSPRKKRTAQMKSMINGIYRFSTSLIFGIEVTMARTLIVSGI